MSLRRLLVILLAAFGGATVAFAGLAAVLGGTPTGLNAVRHLAHLEQLDLSRCRRISDQGLAELVGLAALESLNLSEAREISDQGLAHLSHRESLKELDLSHTLITDTGLTSLKGLSQLRSLRLAGGRYSSHWSTREATTLNVWWRVGNGSNRLTVSR